MVKRQWINEQIIYKEKIRISVYWGNVSSKKKYYVRICYQIEKKSANYQRRSLKYSGFVKVYEGNRHEYQIKKQIEKQYLKLA